MEGATANKSPKDLLRRIGKAGFDRAFLYEAVLPDWWDASCEKDASLLSDLEIRTARFLRVPLETVRDPSVKLASPAYANARLRKVSKIGDDRLGATIHSALSVAGAVVRSTRQELATASLPPREPGQWHRELSRSVLGASLDSVVADLWRRGIPVIHVEIMPSPRVQGLACLIEGRPVVVIGHDIDVPARLLSHVAHEVGHIVRGDCEEDAPVVDEDDQAPDRHQMERDADRYALVSALGESPPDAPGAAHWAGFKQVATEASAVGRARGLDVGALIWAWTVKTRQFALGALALRAAYKHLGGARVLRTQFDKYIDITAASDSDRALLRCVKGDPERNAPPG